MTISVTTDHALIRKTIRDWLGTYTGGLEVDYSNQEVPRLPKPCATILILSSGQKTGIAEEREEYSVANDVIERTTTIPTQIVAQCEVYTEPATDPNTPEAAELLENALLALDAVPVRDAFRVAKLGVLSHSQITRLDEQLGDRWERRAVADVTFVYSGETFDDGLTGDSGNIVETVETPTEEGGNLVLAGTEPYTPPPIPQTGGQGLEWAPQTSGTSEHLWGIDGIGDLIRLASGESNVVARSIDGGQNWAIDTSQTSPSWENVRCRADGLCLLVGLGTAANNLKRSVDAGASWSPVDSGSPDDVYDALYEPSTDAWLICSLSTGAAPYLRRSVDDGLNWAEATHTFDNDLLAMATDGAGRVVVVGQNGLNGYSTDGGQNWTQNANLSGAIQDVAHDPVTDNFVAVTGTSNLYYSTNGGQSWQLATNPTAHAGDLRGVYFNELGIGIVVGRNKTILRTVDGGVTYAVINETEFDTELLAVFHGGKTWHTSGRSGTILTAP